VTLPLMAANFLFFFSPGSFSTVRNTNVGGCVPSEFACTLRLLSFLSNDFPFVRIPSPCHPQGNTIRASQAARPKLLRILFTNFRATFTSYFLFKGGFSLGISGRGHVRLLTKSFLLWR